jgi:hypothetical protein
MHAQAAAMQFEFAWHRGVSWHIMSPRMFFGEALVTQCHLFRGCGR